MSKIAVNPVCITAPAENFIAARFIGSYRVIHVRECAKLSYFVEMTEQRGNAAVPYVAAKRPSLC